MKHTKETFHWIVSLLKKHRVPFRITGGLAARAYGAKRKLLDIDIDIDQRYFKKIKSEINPYIIYEPKRRRDRYFDIYGASLKYKGQVIDLCGIGNAKVFDKESGKWRLLKANFKNNKIKMILGKKVLVHNKKDLIEYKKILNRKVDRIDIKAINL